MECCCYSYTEKCVFCVLPVGLPCYLPLSGWVSDLRIVVTNLALNGHENVYEENVAINVIVVCEVHCVNVKCDVVIVRMTSFDSDEEC